MRVRLVQCNDRNHCRGLLLMGRRSVVFRRVRLRAMLVAGELLPFMLPANLFTPFMLTAFVLPALMFTPFMLTALMLFQLMLQPCQLVAFMFGPLMLAPFALAPFMFAPFMFAPAPVPGTIVGVMWRCIRR
jgi:hypothetical protein